MRLRTDGRGSGVGFPAGDSPDLDGFVGGCPLFGKIEAFPNQLSVSCGYRVESLPREDWFSDNYDFTGVVLLLIATQERIVIGGDERPLSVVVSEQAVFNTSSVVVSEPVRVAKTAAEIEDPENVYFEDVLMAYQSALRLLRRSRGGGARYTPLLLSVGTT